MNVKKIAEKAEYFQKYFKNNSYHVLKKLNILIVEWFL